MSRTHGTIWWSELMTREPDVACVYYAGIAGWSYEAMPTSGGKYHVASAQGRPVAGIMDMTDLPGMEAVPPHWFTYIAVDDVVAAVAATRAAGGAVIKDVFEVPGIGRIAIIADPAGAAVGIITPVRPA